MYSPDQVRVGDNIYEYIVPQNYVAYMGKDEPEMSDGDYTEPDDFPQTRDSKYYTAIPGDEAHPYTAKSRAEGKSSSSVAGGVRVLPVSGVSQNTPAPPPKPKLMKKQISLDETSKAFKPAKPHYENDIGRATISPIQRDPPKQLGNQGRAPEPVKLISDRGTDQNQSRRAVNNPYKSFSSVTNKTTAKFSTVSEVPADISELTVEDICECLELLNLQKHREAFNRLQVDGSLLQSFDAKVFQEDDNFKMSVAEALKLDRFVKGWRPRRQLNTV